MRTLNPNQPAGCTRLLVEFKNSRVFEASSSKRNHSCVEWVLVRCYEMIKELRLQGVATNMTNQQLSPSSRTIVPSRRTVFWASRRSSTLINCLGKRPRSLSGVSHWTAHRVTRRHRFCRHRSNEPTWVHSRDVSLGPSFNPSSHRDIPLPQPEQFHGAP